jgi:hypothetical protein
MQFHALQINALCAQISRSICNLTLHSQQTTTTLTTQLSQTLSELSAANARVDAAEAEAVCMAFSLFVLLSLFSLLL